MTKYDTIGYITFPDENEGCTDGPTYYNNSQSTRSIAVSNISGDTIEYTCGTGGVDFFKNQKFEGIYFIPHAREQVDPSQFIIIDNAVLNGKTFTDVYESKYVPGTNIYYVKNIGVIKTEISNDTTNYVESWSLLRYHVVQ
jgi:hypothetical protein